MVKTSSVSLQPWVPAVLGVAFALAAHDIISLYYRLQWSEFSRHTLELGAFAQRDFEFILGRIGFYRSAAALLAVAFSFWALSSKPRWPGLVALLFCVVAIFDAARMGWLS
jgi:hypothetical protein